MVLITLVCNNALAEQQRNGWLDKWMAPYRHEARTSVSVERPALPAERSKLLNYTGTRTLRLRNATSRVDPIKEVQRELLTRGYYAGELDGLVGADTRAAIMHFQQDLGAQQTGRINSTLLDQLEQRAITRTPYMSNRRSNFSQQDFSAIGEAQHELSRMGYYNGPIDGVLNPATRDAIRDYRSNPYNQHDADLYGSGYEYPRSDSSPAAAPTGLQTETLDTLLANPPAIDYALAPELKRVCGLEAFSSGDDAAALQQSNAVIRAADTSMDARRCGFFARGLVYLTRRDAALAIDDFTSVLRLAPSSADAYYNRALAYRDAGMPEFARRDLREAVRINQAFGLKTG